MSEKNDPAEYPKTLKQVIRYFSDKKVAHDFVVSLRWPDGVTCLHCGSKEVGFVQTRFIWNCKSCRKQFSVKVGTIFEDSPLSLEKWVTSIWLISNCENGISSYELARAIGTTQKSAWFLLRRIRHVMNDGSLSKMSGEVEADETHIGGKEKNKHESKKLKAGRGAVGKAIVSGLLERSGGGSKVSAKTIGNTKAKTLQGRIKKTVAKGSLVYTDALDSYIGINPEYIHEIIHHTVVYVRGTVHINGLENFWSLLKRMIRGIYVSVDAFHLDRYLAEEVFRFNERKDTDGRRFVKVLSDVKGKRLTTCEGLVGF